MVSTILNSKRAFRFNMMNIIIIMLTTFIKIPELFALNFTEGEWKSKNHRDLFVWPFALDECQVGSCGRGLLGFKRRCRSGLECAQDNQEKLASYGLDRQFAYCQIPNSRGRRCFCYDPTKLISPSVRPSSKPSVSIKPSSKPSQKPSAKPSRKPSAKPSSQPTHTTKKCFTLNSDLKSAVATYNASNTIQKYGNISDWCVGKVTDFSTVFFGSSFNQDISNWNTSSATNMYTMFYNAASFNQNISKWDVSKVTNMKLMFGETSSFNQDISKWDVSKVTNMDTMFYNARSFNQDLSSWNIAKVTTIYSMFSKATSFNQNMCSWNTKCQSLIDSRYAFGFASRCPNQTNPVCGSGPFCYNCN